MPKLQHNTRYDQDLQLGAPVLNRLWFVVLLFTIIFTPLSMGFTQSLPRHDCVVESYSIELRGGGTASIGSNARDCTRDRSTKSTICSDSNQRMENVTIIDRKKVNVMGNSTIRRLSANCIEAVLTGKPQDHVMIGHQLFFCTPMHWKADVRYVQCPISD